MANLEPLKFRFRCGAHNTDLRIQGRKHLGPLFVPTDVHQTIWAIDLGEMFCPLDPQGGHACIRSWGPQEVNFTLLPHGLLQDSGTGLEDYSDVRAVGEGEGSSSPGTVERAEEGDGQRADGSGLDALAGDEPVHAADDEAGDPEVTEAAGGGSGSVAAGDRAEGDPLRGSRNGVAGGVAGG